MSGFVLAGRHVAWSRPDGSRRHGRGQAHGPRVGTFWAVPDDAPESVVLVELVGDGSEANKYRFLEVEGFEIPEDVSSLTVAK